MHWGRPPRPREQNDWQTFVKPLPSATSFADGKNGYATESRKCLFEKSWQCYELIRRCSQFPSQTHFTHCFTIDFLCVPLVCALWMCIDSEITTDFNYLHFWDKYLGPHHQQLNRDSLIKTPGKQVLAAASPSVSTFASLREKTTLQFIKQLKLFINKKEVRYIACHVGVLPLHSAPPSRPV